MFTPSSVERLLNHRIVCLRGRQLKGVGLLEECDVLHAHRRLARVVKSGLQPDAGIVRAWNLSCPGAAAGVVAEAKGLLLAGAAGFAAGACAFTTNDRGVK